jgi:hypothetical protein
MITRKRLAPKVATETLPIADIRVGKRHRRDMGDIAGVAASLAEVGLLASNRMLS